MHKPQRTREQLRIAISTRLALSSACPDEIEVSVFPTDDKGGWDAAGSSLRGPLNAYVECLAFLKIVVSALQAEFDLAQEAPDSGTERPKPPLEPPHFPTSEGIDEAANKISRVALALRENIAARLSDIPPSNSDATPPQRVQDNQEQLRAVTHTPIVETIYPADPSGAVVVRNHAKINLHSAEYREFNTKVDDLLTLLRDSNDFSGEVRDQLIAEISAGKTLLSAPKVDPFLIEQFLTNPFRYIADKSVETATGALTVALLMLLGKLTS